MTNFGAHTDSNYTKTHKQALLAHYSARVAEEKGSSTSRFAKRRLNRARRRAAHRIIATQLQWG